MYLSSNFGKQMEAISGIAFTYLSSLRQKATLTKAIRFII